jgi:methylated-DNA-[protein]-cysteine S-methyltransferase
MTFYYSSPIGPIRIEVTDKGISSLIFEGDSGTPSPGTPTPGTPTHQMESLSNEMESRVLTQLNEYITKKRQVFNLPLDLQGTDFQKRVWNELLKVPFGKTISYKELTLKLGDIKAIRAVAAANGANPVSIIVPCHRVIGSDGSLTGYAGGLWRKKWLLDHESKELLLL